jgi:hypothetical protein
LHSPIVDRRGGVRLVAEQHRRGEHPKARIDPDKEVHRSDIALNIAKLHALDFARDGAELARRVDLDFDAALRGFFDFLFVEFDELVLGLVDRRGAELHNEIRRGRRNRAERAGEGGGDSERGGSASMSGASTRTNSCAQVHCSPPKRSILA